MKAFYLTALAIFVCGPAIAQPKTHTLKFSMAHDAENKVVVKCVEDLAAALNKDSGGALKLELKFYPLDVFTTFPESRASVASGEFDMSQIGTETFTDVSPKLRVFNIPFLFKSHSQMRQVVDGETGVELKQDLLAGSNNQIRALGFTYSGGFRQFLSRKQINSLEDLAGMKVDPEQRGELATFDAFHLVQGEQHRQKGKNKAVVGEQLMSKSIDAHSDTFSRLFGAVRGLPHSEIEKFHIAETNHSLFVTAVVINEKAYQALPRKLRKILDRNVKLMVDRERELSIERAEEHRKILVKLGVKVKAPDATLASAMVKATEGVRAGSSAELGPLVKAIEKLGGAQVAGSVR